MAKYVFGCKRDKRTRLSGEFNDRWGEVREIANRARRWHRKSGTRGKIPICQQKARLAAGLDANLSILIVATALTPESYMALFYAL